MSDVSLVFHETEFAVVEKDGQNWVTGLQVASALGYKNPSADSINLYNRHAEEFTPGMTQIIKLMTPGGYQDVRVFSLRGAHLLAMFARTERAAEFRRWVLDILDGAISAVPPAPTFVTSNLSHGADLIVAADRTFRGVLRAARSAGMGLPQALRVANQQTILRTGMDMLHELGVDPDTPGAGESEMPADDPVVVAVTTWAANAEPERYYSIEAIVCEALGIPPGHKKLVRLVGKVGPLLRRLGWRRERVRSGRHNMVALWIKAA